MQRFLLGDDTVLVKAAAAAVGTEPLKALVIHFTEKGELVKAAQIEFALSAFGTGRSAEHENAVLALLEQSGEATLQVQQMEVDILVWKAYHSKTKKSDEAKRYRKRIEEPLAANSALRTEPIGLAFAQHWPRLGQEAEGLL